MKASVAAPTNNWYVITGAPSAGKSTIIKRLRESGYATCQEMGRQLIDQQLAAGKTLQQIHVDSPEFEIAWVRLQRKAEALLSKEQITFLDRGVLDTLAYFAYYGWPIPAEITRCCSEVAYKKVFLLEMLDYEQDYARIESAETATQLQRLFGDVYRKAGYEVVRVPRDSVENRLHMILEYLA